MLNQVITILVFSLMSSIAGWYFGAFCQRRVDDRERARLLARHDQEMESSFGDQSDVTEPFFNPDLNSWDGKKSQIEDIIAANDLCVDLISNELKDIHGMLMESFADMEESRAFRTELMESAILTHAKFDRQVRAGRPIHESIELLRDLNAALGEIEEQSVQVRSVAAEVNLLAANAGLEASRAGANGRSFAVFADCMQNLSDKGTDSIMDIYELVDKTKHDLENVIQLLEPDEEVPSPEIEDVLSGFSELEQQLTKLDQATARTVSNLDWGAKRIHDLEGKVHALADSLSNGFTEIFDETEFEKSDSEAS